MGLRHQFASSGVHYPHGYRCQELVDFKGAFPSVKEFGPNITASMAQRMISVVYQIFYLEWSMGPISVLSFCHVCMAFSQVLFNLSPLLFQYPLVTLFQ